MFYTINSSPLFVTKSVFILTIILNSYQKCSVSLNSSMKSLTNLLIIQYWICFRFGRRTYPFPNEIISKIGGQHVRAEGSLHCLWVNGQSRYNPCGDLKDTLNINKTWDLRHCMVRYRYIFLVCVNAMCVSLCQVDQLVLLYILLPRSRFWDSGDVKKTPVHSSLKEGIRPCVPGLICSIVCHSTLLNITWCFKGIGIILQKRSSTYVPCRKI